METFRFALAETAAGIGFWEFDVESGRIWGDATAMAMFGMPAAEGWAPGDEVLAPVHPDDRDAMWAAVDSAMATGHYIAEFRVVRPDGMCRWMHSRGALVTGATIDPVRLVGVTLDVTDRRRDEEQLRSALADNERLQTALRDENVLLQREVDRGGRLASITGTSTCLMQVLRQAERVAGTNSTVLLLGETGTGKERFASLIHGLSDRRRRTMVRVNCAAIPSTLIESELFGREKGAYTGSLSRQIGRFELANGSTIFLDEVGDLPPDVQVKLLRVLQERQIERLGNPTPIPVDVRVIAATHCDLEEAVNAGRFRSDLYYRLNVFPIAIPPLRERREDIPLLVHEIVADLEHTMSKHFEYIAKASMDGLVRYAWPGNVRELQNVLERAMILCDGPTLRVALPNTTDTPEPGNGDSLDDVDRAHVLTVLVKAGWRVRGAGGAAEALGLKPTTLEHRMVKLGIARPGKS